MYFNAGLRRKQRPLEGPARRGPRTTPVAEGPGDPRDAAVQEEPRPPRVKDGGAIRSIRWILANYAGEELGLLSEPPSTDELAAARSEERGVARRRPLRRNAPAAGRPPPCGDQLVDVTVGLLISSESLRIPSHWNIGASGVRERGNGEAAPAASGDAGDGAWECTLILTIVLNTCM